MSDLWKSVLSEMEQTIGLENFRAWFTGSELIEIENNVATVGVNNIFKATQIKTRYLGALKSAFEAQGSPVKEIKCEVVSQERKPNTLNERRAQPIAKAASKSHAANFAGGTLQTGLNPRYTLDNFVVGSGNELAAMVARRIVDNPGVDYNPFFLYGGPGLGKTHLVQAIGNAILERNPNFRVLYTPVSNFYSDFIRSLKDKKVDEFRQKFMKLDMLIVDDFQMIVNKDASQAEFFDIFNALNMANKHIIVTSDRMPDQIKSVDERLASRLTWAGAYDLQFPQFEDRCAILRAKADIKGVNIEDEAIEYIAENVQTNIRSLEGELDHILAMADLKNMTPLEVIKQGFVSTRQGSRTKAITPKQVVEKVAKYYQLTVKEMCGKSRVANIKTARQVAMFVLSKELNMSTPKIAAEVGVKDHTTVMHGIKKIQEDTKLNFALRDEISAIKESLYA